MGETSIEWTNATWNPVAGCSVLTAGCSNCYAMRMAARLEAMGVAKYSGLTRRSGGRAVWTGAITLDQEALAQPLRWKRPRKIFVNSMSDLFHEGVPAAFVSDVWEVMARATHHTFQILTKRPDRMAEILVSEKLSTLQNVWLGTSVEDKKVMHRIDELRAIRAAVRFISFEPLIGSVGEADLRDIHWAIVGGESGPKARPMEEAWIEEIRRACHRHGTAFFFKQWGGPNKKAAGRTYLGQTWDHLPRVSM